jgi:hypothetical protein
MARLAMTVITTALIRKASDMMESPLAHAKLRS